MGSVGKVDDLVSQAALDQLDELYKRLGITKDQMVSATEQAAKFTAALGDTKGLTDFTAAQDKANASMQQVIASNATIIGQQKEITIQTQSVADAVKVKVAADANADAVLKQVGGTLDANIKQLIEQKLELKQVNDELKALGKTYAGSVQSQTQLSAKTAELTKQQLTLKDSIAAQNLLIKQQVKENNAAATSQDAMLARLNQLRKTYNSLSEEERNNAQVGGVLLANIRQLATATTAINEAQGKYNDSVGKYEDAIKSAISSYVPFGNQLVKAVNTYQDLTKGAEGAEVAVAGVGTQFAAFTIGAFAVGMAAAVYYLQQFRDTGNQVEQFVGGLKNQFSGVGKNFLDAFKNPVNAIPTVLGINLFKDFSKNFQQGVDVTKQIQDVRNLNEVNDQLVQKQQAQADQLRAQSKNVKLSQDERIASLKQAQGIETEIIAQQFDNAQKNIAAGIAIANAVKPLTSDQTKILQSGSEGAIRYANDLVKTGQITEAGYEAIMAGYQKQTQAMNAANMKLIRQQNDESKIELKQAKELNNDQLELQKAKLQGEKETAQLILNDDKQGYQARLAALQVFVNRSKEIIGVENTIANRAPGITGTKKLTNNQVAKNQTAQVDNFDLTQLAKLQDEVNKQVAAEQKKAYDQTVSLEKAKEDLITNGYNQELLDLDYVNSQKILKVTQAYSDGLISEKNYQRQIRKLQKDGATEAVDIQIKALEEIAGAQAAGLALGFGSSKDLQGTANRIKGLKTQKIKLQTEGITGQATGGFISPEALESAKEALAFSDQAVKALDIVQGLIDSNAKAKIDALEKEFTLIQQNAEAEKTAVGNSILSSKEKSREQQIIDAQTAQQRLRITQEENEVKKKAAEFDKAAAIAKIIQQTAVAVVTALTIPIYGEALAIVIGALGAAQLAIAISTPIPQFYKGGTVSKDGPIITGEQGTELRIDPSGRMSFTEDHANVTYAKTGTKIINNTDLVKMLGKPERVQYIATATNDNRKVEKLLEESNQLAKRKQPPVVKVYTDKWAYGSNRNY